MTTAERIFEEVQILSETEARHVLEFAMALKTSRARSSATQDVAIFDQYEALDHHPLDRNACAARLSKKNASRVCSSGFTTHDAVERTDAGESRYGPDASEAPRI